VSARDDGFLVALEADCWHVAAPAGKGKDQDQKVVVNIAKAVDGPETDEAVAQLTETLGSMGYGGRGVCLGLPADMVFSAQIDSANLPRRDKHNAMLYRLEEQLPLEAERLTADFLAPAGGMVMGLAVETAPVSRIVDLLDEAGIPVAAICPTAMLALWQHRGLATAPGDYIVLGDSRLLEVFRMAQNQPDRWYTTTATARGLLDCIQADMLAGSMTDRRPHLHIIGNLPTDAPALLAQKAGVVPETHDEHELLLHAAHTAEMLLSGRQAGWVDLRRDDLAPVNPWGRLSGLADLAAALMLVLAGLMGGMFYLRAAQYESAAGASERRQRDAYVALYPGRSAPVNVKSALASELRRLSGVRGINTDIPAEPCALDTLKGIAAALPRAMRMRIVQVRLDPNSVYIEGQARDHTAAQITCRGLLTAGFQMAPPRTEHLSGGGVAFTLTGKPPSGSQERPKEVAAK